MRLSMCCAALRMRIGYIGTVWSIPHADYLKYGSESKVKEAGKLRVKAKHYTVRDGDAMHARFNAEHPKVGMRLPLQHAPLAPQPIEGLAAIAAALLDMDPNTGHTAMHSSSALHNSDGLRM